MTKIFLDTNIVLEGKPLQDLPWSEIDPIGPISVMILPTVLKEVDKKKRDGRLGEKARIFNRLIAPAATSGELIIIRDKAPRVELSVPRCARIDWDALSDLDPHEPDACIVAQMLAVVDVPDSDKVLVSQDINPLAMAHGKGLRTIHISTDWLAPREPSPAEKEITRLKQKVRDLETTEPKLSVLLDVLPGPFTVRAVTSMDNEDRSSLLTSIMSKIKSPNRMAGLLSAMDFSYDRRLDEFRTKTVPDFVREFELNLSRTFAQVPFRVEVSNGGPVRADRLIVKITSAGATIHDKYVVIIPSGPPAPRSGTGMDHLFDRLPRAPASIGRHEIHFDTEPEVGARLIEVHCEDFRHGRTWTFSGVMTLDHQDSTPANIDVSVTASNLHGTIQASAVITKEIVEVAVSEIVDMDQGIFIVELPMKAALDAALESDDFSSFEVVGADDD
jgi:hypothetical protein